MCPDFKKYVCAIDGNTYLNKCLAEKCYKTKVESKGICTSLIENEKKEEIIKINPNPRNPIYRNKHTIDDNFNFFK